MTIAARERADRELYQVLLPEILTGLARHAEPLELTRKLVASPAVAGSNVERSATEWERLVFRWVIATQEEIERGRKRRAIFGVASIWIGSAALFGAFFSAAWRVILLVIGLTLLLGGAAVALRAEQAARRRVAARGSANG